jgi:hypothetical protein
MLIRRLASLCALAMTSVWAQTTQGTFTGTVTDPQGAGAPNVQVVVKNTGTSLTYKGITSDDGTYVIPAVPAGPYELTATSTGFKAHKQTSLILEVSQRLKVDIRLEIGAVSESVQRWAP